MIVFGIDCNFFIVLSIRLKNCRSNVFFTRQNVYAGQIARVSEVLRARARPMGIGRAICSGLHYDPFFSYMGYFFAIAVGLLHYHFSLTSVMFRPFKNNKLGTVSK